jgi:hypothetical protein
MALTYRSVKGSALTNTELDDNFRHFTGSHSITGSLTISGNISSSGNVTFDNLPTSSTGLDTGSLWLSGSDSSGSQFLMVYNP